MDLLLGCGVLGDLELVELRCLAKKKIKSRALFGESGALELSQIGPIYSPIDSN